MSKRKFTSGLINKKVIILLFFISFLYVFNLSRIPEELTFSDMALTVLYGVNTSYSVSLVEIVKWSIPYIIIIYFVGIYVEKTVLKKNLLIWMIRSRSYNKWLWEMSMNMLLIITAYLISFFSFTCILSVIFSGDFSETAVFFKENNTYMSKESITQIYILIQFLLSLTTMALISLIQVIITICFNNSTSGMIFSIFIISMFGILSRFNIINPLMLSKCNIIDNRLEVYPSVIIIINIVLTISIYLLLSKKIRSIIRR